jgi:hypothetical protein
VTWVTFGFFVLLNAYYRLGAGGVSVSGADVSFERRFDVELFDAKDGLAFLLTKSGSVSLVKIERGAFPFCPLCGEWEPAGSVVNVVGYSKGAWIYSDHASPFFEAWNLETGESVDLDASLGPLREHLPIELEAVGLDYDAEHRLTDQLVARDYPALSPINESCVVFNMAFFLIFVVLLTIAVTFLLRRPSPNEAGPYSA